MTAQPAIKLRPSDAHRWLVCRASPGDIAAHPERCSKEVFDYTQEGTVAHNYAAAILCEQVPPEDGVTDEMRRLIPGYVDYVHGLMTPSSTLLVEAKVKLFYDEKRSGYVDAIVYEPDGSAIHIVDLKYGRGVSVPVEKNAQLIIYLRSLLEELHERQGIEFAWDAPVSLTIYQPRIQGEEVERIWETTIEEVCAQASLIQEVADSIAADPFNQPFDGSDDHACQFCPLVGDCKYRAAFLLGEALGEPEQPLQLVDSLEVAEMGLPEVTGLTPSQIARILAVAGPMKQWLGKVEDHAAALLLEQKAEIPGYKLVSSRPHRSWTDPAEAERLLRRMFKREEVVTEKILSPAQALELVKSRKHTRPKTVERLQQLIYQPAGDPVLVRESDKRPPYERLDVAQEFDSEEDGAELL